MKAESKLDFRGDRIWEIDAIPAKDYDAIVLVYGVCGKATTGLTARTLPMMIPRAPDSITPFLGDRARYQDQFENQPGTYWNTIDYIERRLAREAPGAGAETSITWDDNYLRLEAGEQIAMTYDQNLIGCVLQPAG